MPVDDYYQMDMAFIENEMDDYGYENERESTAPAYSTVYLSYWEDEDLDSVLLRYSSAVKVVTSLLFAITGCKKK